MSQDSKHYHFIGIGGIGMGALAMLLLDKGFRVTGSDAKQNAMTAKLTERGASVFEGHASAHIEGADVVVYSSAIKADNAELSAAREAGLSVYRRADLLAELMRGYTGITVAGAHGKTTTTSMLLSVLTAAGLNPTTAVGGVVKGLDTNAQTGTGAYFLAEVDESDGSFLGFTPTYSIITNIDREHLDHYGSFNAIINAYREFIGRTQSGGLLIVCSDDKNLQQRCRLNATGLPKTMTCGRAIFRFSRRIRNSTVLWRTGFWEESG